MSLIRRIIHAIESDAGGYPSTAFLILLTLIVLILVVKP